MLAYGFKTALLVELILAAWRVTLFSYAGADLGAAVWSAPSPFTRAFPVKASPSRCPPTATPPPWAGLATTEMPGPELTLSAALAMSAATASGLDT